MPKLKRCKKGTQRVPGTKKCKIKKCKSNEVRNKKTKKCEIKPVKKSKLTTSSGNNYSNNLDIPENDNTREKDLSKMIDDKFKNKLVTFSSKKEHLAKFIFWFKNEPDKTPKDSGYMFEIPNTSRSLNDGFNRKEEKDIRKMFSNSKSKINSLSFDDGYQQLDHPTKLLESIFPLAKGGKGPKITKTSVELQYLFPPDDIFHFSRVCESNKGREWKCDTKVPILCVVVENTFILDKTCVKDAIIDRTLPYSLVDDYGQVYHGPGSTQWKNGELHFDVKDWGNQAIELDQGDMDGVYAWKEGGFHFGLNDNCFKILY